MIDQLKYAAGGFLFGFASTVERNHWSLSMFLKKVKLESPLAFYWIA
jgi:hypothetical protein